QLVERNLAKVEVASSNLVVRSASKAPTFPVGAFVVLPPRSSPAALMRFVMSSDDSAHCSRAGSGGNLEA
ncbi:hypothetical protein, partial [Streptomyces sp. Root1295]|uniref:hypothetical protein n=1 Tax=Streptomyces sp. Root1295 TaxID=1736448 RepID=UPI001A7E1BD5